MKRFIKLLIFSMVLTGLLFNSVFCYADVNTNSYKGLKTYVDTNFSSTNSVLLKADKNYVDGSDAVLLAGLTGKLNLSGGTMTGDLFLTGNRVIASSANTNSLTISNGANYSFMTLYGTTFATANKVGNIDIQRYTGGADAGSGQLKFYNWNGTTTVTDAFFNKIGNLNIGTGDTDSATDSYIIYANGSIMTRGTTYFGGTTKNISSLGTAYLKDITGTNNVSTGLVLNHDATPALNNGSEIFLQTRLNATQTYGTLAKIKGYKENATYDDNKGGLRLSTYGVSGVEVISCIINYLGNMTLGATDLASTTKRLYVSGAAQITNGLNLGNISTGTGSSLGIDGSGNVITVTGGVTTPSITATAQENLSVGDIVKLINDGSPKAYKYMNYVPPTESIVNGTKLVSNATYTGASYPCATRLTDTTYAVAHMGASGYVNTFICTVSGTGSGATVTPGVNLVVNAVNSMWLTITGLSDTTYAISFSPVTAGRVNTAICTVSGTGSGATVTLGVNLVVNATTVNNIHSTTLSSNIYAISYAGGSTVQNAVVCTVTGTGSGATVTPGIIATISSVYMPGMSSITRLIDSVFVVSFLTSFQTGTVVSVPCTVTGTGSGATINLGVETTVYPANGGNTYLTTSNVSDTVYAIVVSDSNAYLHTLPCTVSGTGSGATPTPGVAVIVNSGTSQQPSASKLTNTSYVIGWGTWNGQLQSAVCTVTGTGSGAISSFIKSPYAGITTANGDFYGETTLTSTTYALICRSSTNFINTVVETYAPAYSGIVLPGLVPAAISSGSTGSIIPIAPGMQYKNASLNLATMSQYYVGATSAMTTAYNANTYIGTALDTTTIMIDGNSPFTKSGDISIGTLPVSLLRR